jgi:hypothetical protein
VASDLDTHRFPEKWIDVAGVALRPSAVSHLAVRLHKNGHQALGDYLGHGVDMVRHQIPLHESDYAPILAELIVDCPPKLEPLRDHLQAVEKQRTVPGRRVSGPDGRTSVASRG